MRSGYYKFKFIGYQVYYFNFLFYSVNFLNIADNIMALNTTFIASIVSRLISNECKRIHLILLSSSVATEFTFKTYKIKFNEPKQRKQRKRK